MSKAKVTQIIYYSCHGSSSKTVFDYIHHLNIKSIFHIKANEKMVRGNM